MIRQLLPLQITLLFLLFPLYITPQAQSAKDTIIAHQNFKEGDSLSTKGNYAASIAAFEIAASEFKSNKLWKRYIESLNEISYNYYRLEKLDKSLEEANLSLQICIDKLQSGSLLEADALRNVAKIHRKKNKYVRALQLYKKALAITKTKAGPDHIKTANLYTHIGILYDDNFGFVEEANQYYAKSLEINQRLYDSKKENNLDGIYLNLAILYSRNGLYHQGQPYYEKAIQLSKEIYGENTPYIAEYYYNFASNYSYIGEDYLALQYFKKGLNIMKNAYDQNEEFLGIFYEGIGTQYSRLKKPDLAYKNYQKALQIYGQTYGENDFSTANVLSNIAYGVFLQKGNYDLASKYYEKSYTIRKKLFGDEHRNTFKLNQDFGELYETQGQYDIAKNYYNRHLDFALQSFGKKNQKTAECYINKARIHLKKKEFKIAAHEYHNSIVAGTNNFNDISIYSNPLSEDYINPSILLSAVHGKAKAIHHQGKKNNSQKDLQFSLSCYKICDSLIDHTRNSYLSIEDKTLLQKTTSNVYADAVANAMTLYQISDDYNYLTDMFYFSEKNKARLLEEQIQKTKAKNFANIPKDKLEIIEKLKSKLSLYKSKIHQHQTSKEKTSDTNVNKYSDLVFSYTKKLDSVLKLLEREYPKYHTLKYDNSIISVSSIQKKLETNTTILEYFVTDSILYTFAISKHDFQVKEIKINNLSNQISQFRKDIITKDLIAYKKTAYQLYQKLIVPISLSKDTENLIIIPDGSLWYLNFDLLLTNDSDSKNPKELPYFLRKKAISYSNSANLFFSKQPSYHKVLKECLAFSFSDTVPSKTKKELSLAVLRDAGDDLPGTRKEIKAISNIVNGTYFYGREANESNFKDKVSKYAILHLALHGELDDKNPENSKLYFTQVKDSVEDNYLYNHELYALEIPAELAVLSACNTGSGKISKGEGVMSLGRAFQYAGTKSLVLTYWEVLDETTPELMKNFYTNLKKGMTKSKALQQAKIQYLNDAGVYRTDPFYWGGFYLIGDTTPIDLGSNDIFLYILLLASAITFLGFFLYKKYIRKK